MKGKTLLEKTTKTGNLDSEEMEVRTARGKKTSNVKHKMEAASRKVRYAGKHIDVNREDD